MAAAAIMGESSMPKNGYKMPVATDSLRGTQVDGNPQPVNSAAQASELTPRSPVN